MDYFSYLCREMNETADEHKYIINICVSGWFY